MKFSELGIEASVLRALEEVGYEEPTPIQQKAIPPVLEGRDLLGCAQTGTGKTCAFAVPIIQNLCKENKTGVRALILTPTRELALQIYENACQYARYTRCVSAVIYGGVSQVPQVDAIRRGADVLIATPGRLWDLMQQGIVHLDQVEFFVLDEADRMLDMGFFPDVKRIIAKVPQTRQTLLFSATIPKEIAALADSLLTNPVRIAITPSARPVEKIEQKLYFVEKADKRDLLVQIIRDKNVAQTLVFTRTKHGADRVTRDLNRAGIKSRAIHGDKSQGARQTALKEFKECKIAALVATDIAARGIDINELPLVINFDLPNLPETYVHRIGRTGRAGQEGTAISFCDYSERPYLKDIEKLIGRTIPVEGAIEPSAKTQTAVAVPAQPRRSAAQRTSQRRGTSADTPKFRAAEGASHAPRRTPESRKQTTENSAPTRQAAKPALEPRPSRRPAQQKEQPVAGKRGTASRRTAAQKTQEEQRAQQSAPVRKTRAAQPSRGGRGRRRNEYDRFDKNEPRVDIATPVRAGALSEAAAERIRKKVAQAMEHRPSTAVPQQDKQEKSAARAPRRRRR